MVNYSKPINIFVAIGANLVPEGYGSLHEALEDAVAHLSATYLHLIGRSDWFVTTAVPASDQPDFLNAVLAMESPVSALETLRILHEREASFGRTRTKINEARVLDLDLLSYGQSVIDNETITVPHPRLSVRSFVLIPWAQIAPDWRHPVSQVTIADMLEALPSEQKRPPAIAHWHAG